MISGKENLLQSLIEAFLMEKGTREFYAGAAGRVASPHAAKVFSELSDWEKKHMDYIQFLYQSIQQDRDIQGFDDFSKKAVSQIVEGGMPVKDMEAKLGEQGFNNDAAAITLALEIEAKAYSLYRRMSEIASESSARVVFKAMMEQEQKHIDYLKETKKKLA